MRFSSHIGLIAVVGCLAAGLNATSLPAFAKASAGKPNGGGNPAWSPDGKKIVFLSGTPNTPVNVWTVDVRSRGRPHQLTRLGARWTGWAADGRAIYCQTLRGGSVAFYSVDLAGGRERAILSFLPKDVAKIAWSPDGKRVAYLRRHADHRDLWVAGLNGADEHRLTEGMNVWSMDWSRDGKKLAFDVGGVVGETTYVVEASGQGKPQAVFKGIGSYPSWSPDGSRLVLLGMHTLTLVSKDGRNSRRLHVSQADRAPLDWSPEGKSLAYTSVQGDRYGISIINVDSGKAVCVSSGWAEAAFPRWSPDGRYLIFEATEKGGYASNVYLLDVHRQRRYQLTRAFPSYWASKWSGDGKRLHFLSNATEGGIFRLCRSTSDEKNLRALLPVDPRMPVQFSWPKGSKQGIAVSGKQIWRLPAAGAPGLVLETEHPTWADISPDGGALAYVKWQNHRPSLVLRQIGKGTENELLAPPISGLTYSKLTWSPTAKEIAFVRGAEVCKASAVDGTISVLSAPGEGEGETVVLPPAWSPDGKRIAFGRLLREKGPRLEIWIVGSCGKQARLVASSWLVAERGLYADALALPYAWSPDGKRLAFCLERQGLPALYMISLGAGTGGRPRLLRRAASYPAWSPNGREIAYTALQGNRETIRLLRVSGGRDRPLEIRGGRASPGGKGTGGK